MADSQFEAVAASKTPSGSAPVPAAEAEPAWRQSARGARNAVRAGFVAFAVTILSAMLSSKAPEIFGSIAMFTALAALLAVIVAGVRSLIALYGMATGEGRVAYAAPLESIFIVFMAGFGLFIAFMSTFAFSRGRQLRKRGKLLLPPVEPGGGWAKLGLNAALPSGVRSAVAARWRENGRTEHASVAAFARLTLDLMALGAPPELVADANRDALDEIRHTELCFGLARAIDGSSESPGAFPEASRARALSRSRTLALAQLAVDSLVDGALHEGVSARIIAKLARRCEAPAIQTILKEIAADEGRHARHGWDVVRWCLAEGGESVAHALEGALRALPKTMSSPMPEVARDGRWERWGIMGEQLEAEEHEATRTDLERRLGQAIAATRSGQSAFGYGNVSVG